MVNVSMGFDTHVGFQVETNFAEGADTTIGAGGTVDGMGVVTDFSFNPSVTRHHTYGLGSQTRRFDPIITQQYEWSVDLIWQDTTGPIVADNAYEFVKEIVSNIGTARKSWCIKVLATPDGSNVENLYLEGATVNDLSMKASIGEVITVSISGQAKELLGDDWSATAYPTGSTSVTIDDADPAVYHQSDIAAFSTITDFSAQLQSWSLDLNWNSIRIDSYDSGGKMILQAQGKYDISVSGSFYGDSTSIGAGETFSDMATGSDPLTIAIDGTKTFTLAGFSLDSLTYPFKDSEMLIVDFEGMANTVSLD